MTSTQLANEGLGEHAFEFGGIEGACVFSRSLEGVYGRVEIAWLARDIAARCLVGGCRAGESFDFLLRVSVMV